MVSKKVESVFIKGGQFLKKSGDFKKGF